MKRGRPIAFPKIKNTAPDEALAYVRTRVGQDAPDKLLDSVRHSKKSNNLQHGHDVVNSLHL